MKYIIATLIVFMASCSTNTNENNLKKGEQSWKLVRMTGSFINSESTGSDMAWQETIKLKENGSFEKTRQRDGQTITVNGNYNYSEFEDGTYLILDYGKENELIGNCTGNLKETYWVISDSKLQGTWLACDGPGLEYELTN